MITLPYEAAIDKIVGKNFRSIRLQHGQNQALVGKHLGITFQQIQKNEQGKNRIGAGRLYQLSILYGTTPNRFYDSLPILGQITQSPHQLESRFNIMISTVLQDETNKARNLEVIERALN